MSNDFTWRLVECRKCGHMLRFGKTRCGYCQHPTPWLNRYPVYLPVVIVVSLGYIAFHFV